MKKFLLSILCCLLAVVSGYADEYSYTFTSKQFTANDESKNLGNVTWTLTGDGEYWDYDGKKGIQLGSSKKPYKTMTLSTNQIEGTITKIVINTSGASKVNASFVVTVDGVQYGTPTNISVDPTDYTFTGSSSGEVKFLYTQTSSKALYIKSITITYTTSTGDSNLETLEVPVFTPAEGDFSNSVEISIAAADGATIYYTTDGTEPTEESMVYSEPFTIYSTTTVRAFAKKDGFNNSFEASKKYTKVWTLNNASVAETMMAYNSGDKIVANATVVGYIVGAIKDSNINNANFEGDWTNNTNLILADDADETNIENCLPVQLPSGNVRSALNLVDHPENHKKKVILTGSVETYFTVAGLKSVSAYEFIEEPWGSLYYLVSVEIPSSVKAYIVTAANNSYVTLQQVTGVLPAQTGIIYNGEWGSPVFTSGEFANVDGNLLEGSEIATNITEEAYVLAKVDGEVGFYKAQMNQLEGTAFKNNANKAYLPVSALPAAVQGANGFKFRFETTGVEGVQVAQGKKVIFDLSGRKVNDMTAPGVYIVNGKKVLVK